MVVFWVNYLIVNFQPDESIQRRHALDFKKLEHEIIITIDNTA